MVIGTKIFGTGSEAVTPAGFGKFIRKDVRSTAERFGFYLNGPQR